MEEDIVNRLRNYALLSLESSIYVEAADEIEVLRVEIEALHTEITYLEGKLYSPLRYSTK